jgi:phospholipase C
MIRRSAAVAAAAALVGALGALPTSAVARDQSTTTPIRHLVVIFQENVSFDHYFGTYPNAANPAGQPAFHAAPGTPAVNGLSQQLLTANPNAANPFRLDRSQALTCSQNHSYTAEQKAFDGGAMDKFVENTNRPTCGTPGAFQNPNEVMGYYDGNTVTGMWNLAQHFAMSDNSYSTVFGPSTPGALNLVSGQTHAVEASSTGVIDNVPGELANSTVIGDPDPLSDDCAAGFRVQLKGRNVGDLLNAKRVTWGWFQGGFRPTVPSSGTTPAQCASSHNNIAGNPVRDYSPHHEPFQYYASTANPHHLPPSSPAMIGQTDQANHQYDLADFHSALQQHRLPAVSFLKAAGYQDGHAANSDPLDEQHFVVDTINKIGTSPEWRDTAVVVAYDDSDGWYDHAFAANVNPSMDKVNTPSSDQMNGNGLCGSATATPLGGFQGRCGYGPRQPLLVVSPYAKQNHVDHTLTDQTSILRFIEDNWRTGRIGGSSFDELAGPLTGMLDLTHEGRRTRAVQLDPETGLVVGGEHHGRR